MDVLREPGIWSAGSPALRSAENPLGRPEGKSGRPEHPVVCPEKSQQYFRGRVLPSK